MSDQIEITVRLGSFLCIFLLMTFWEVLSPRRQLAVRKRHRWASNLSLVALNTVLVRLIIPITTVGAAIAADARGWGLLQLIDLEAKKGDEAHCRDAHNELRPIFLLFIAETHTMSCDPFFSYCLRQWWVIAKWVSRFPEPIQRQ